MKKINSILILFLLTVSFCKAQMKSGITTEEEYNYMTKGYHVQVSNGLDMKKGYAVGEAISIKDGNYTFDFIPLYKVGSDSTFVGYIVKAYSAVWGNKYNYGIPIGNKELLNKFFQALSPIDASMSQAFFKAYMQLQTNLINVKF